MWIIELNVAGHQFNHRVPDLHRSGRATLRLGRRTVHRYVPQLRQSRAA